MKKQLDFVENIERIHVKDITFEDFLLRYEKGSKPVIIEGVAEGWPAWKNWQVSVSEFDNLIYIRNSLKDLVKVSSSVERVIQVESSK